MDNFYDLLGISRNLPGWKIRKRLYEVIEELKEAYYDGLPGEFVVPLETLGDQDLKDHYDSMLEWSEEGRAIDLGVNADRHIEFAEQALHFRFERVDGGKVVIHNRGVKEPPPPPVPASLRPSGIPPKPADSHSPSTPQGKDAFGRIDGRIPPVALGQRVFEILFAPNLMLESAHVMADFVHLSWVQHFEGRTNRFAFREFHGPLISDSFQPGRTYFALKLRELTTGEATHDVFMGTNTDRMWPLISSEGTWGRFPWHHWLTGKSATRSSARGAAQTNWQALFPGRRVPEDNYFGGRLKRADYHKLLAEYAETVCFWARAHLAGYSVSPSKPRRLAKEDAGAYLRLCADMSPREISKLGLPAPG